MCKGRGRPKKRWMDCVKDDINKTVDRDGKKEKNILRRPPKGQENADDRGRERKMT